MVQCELPTIVDGGIPCTLLWDLLDTVYLLWLSSVLPLPEGLFFLCIVWHFFGSWWNGKTLAILVQYFVKKIHRFFLKEIKNHTQCLPENPEFFSQLYWNFWKCFHLQQFWISKVSVVFEISLRKFANIMFFKKAYFEVKFNSQDSAQNLFQANYNFVW